MKLTSYADWFFVGVLSLVAVVAMTSVESALGVVLPISGIGASLLALLLQLMRFSLGERVSASVGCSGACLALRVTEARNSC